MDLNEKHILFKESLPHAVLKAIDKLNKNDYKAFVVGGAVRNFLLGRKITDYDLCTSATPEQIKDVFTDFKTLSIGAKFGTVMVLIEDEFLEITTFRREDDYYDGRHPGTVEFSSDLDEDLSRRDFTINAMAYDPSDGFIDLYGGDADIRNKTIRAVGNAETRITEDYLRMLRAVRLATELDFNLDDELLMAIKANAEGLKKISKERISNEFNRILLSNVPSKGMLLLVRSGLLAEISQDLYRMYGFEQDSSFHDDDLFTHTIKVLDGTKADLDLRLAALFHDVGKPSTKEIDEHGEGRYFGHQKVSALLAEEFLKDYRYSNKIIEKVVMLIQRHMDCANAYTPKSVKKLISRMGNEVYTLFELQAADVLATNRKSNIDNINNGKELADTIINEKQTVDESGLAINGDDLIKIGYKQGVYLGSILKKLTDMVLEDESINTNKSLLEIAKNLLYMEDK